MSNYLTVKSRVLWLLVLSTFFFGCTKSIGVTSIRLSESSLTMKIGESSTLVAILEPANADYDYIKWVSSDPSVASVSDGIVWAHKTGKAQITASAGGVTSLPCSVTVDVIHVCGVSLNITSAELTEGEELTLTADVQPSDAADKDVRWSSSNPGVATVSGGIVTAVAEGTAVITVTSEDMGHSATCQLTVNKKVVPVTGLNLSESTLSLVAGGTHVLKAEILPENATDKEINWSSSDPSVASVDSSTGEVTAVAPGTASISCTTADGSVTASCTVTVEAAVVRVSDVSLDSQTLTLKEGETATLTASVSPSDATDRSVSWFSSDPSVASVDSSTGEVTALSAGTAIITCKTTDGGKTASCEVTVEKKEEEDISKVTGIELSDQSLFLAVGKTYVLKAKVLPETALNREVTWSSSNSEIATVLSGVVTAKMVGTVTITAKTKEGGMTATCKVTIARSIISVTGVSLEPSSLSLTVGESAAMKATLSPSNATNTGVSWSSSNTAVATVSSEGVVTANSAGTATITVTTNDGGKTASASVKVSAPAGTLTMIPRRNASPSGENIFRYNEDGDCLMTVVSDMNTMYKQAGRSADEFHALYDMIQVMSGTGVVQDYMLGSNHVIRWELSGDELWEYSGRNVSIAVRFVCSKNPALVSDAVVLTASIADVAKVVNLTSSNYIKEYWTSDFQETLFNPSVPDLGSTDSNMCQFEKNLNFPFITNENGIIRFSGVDYEDIRFHFCRDMRNITRIGEYSVRFSVSSDGETLYATCDGATELVGEIHNEPSVTSYHSRIEKHIFKWNKGGTIADKLLNTGEMILYFGAELITKAGRSIVVHFDGRDHFVARLIRPIFTVTKSADAFIGIADFGEKGSYIKAEDLISVIDWRNRAFTTYPNYWDYYGPFEILLDQVEYDANGTRSQIPDSIIVMMTKKGETSVKDPVSGASVSLPANDHGYLMMRYRDTIKFDDYNLFIKLKVKYGFGEIVTDWITIPVRVSALEQ